MSHWLTVSYITYVITYLTGLTLFWRFDVRRRPLRRRLVGLHLLMAVLTFIGFAGVMSLYAFGGPAPGHIAARARPPRRTTMWDYVAQHQSELARLHHHVKGHWLLPPPDLPHG